MLHWAPCPVHAQAQHAGSDGTCRRHRSGDAVRGGQPAIYFLGTGIHRLLPYVQTRLRGQGENAGRRAEGYGLRHTPKSAVVRWVVYASRRNKEGTCDTHPCTSALGDDLTLAGSPSQRQSCSAPQDRRSARSGRQCVHASHGRLKADVAVLVLVQPWSAPQSAAAPFPAISPPFTSYLRMLQ